MHVAPLLINLTVSLVVALTLGLITERLRLSPIVGYLLAGIALGPQTPGFVGDAAMAAQLAEIGVVLLMFGVGMQFDLKELWVVKNIALPGAVGQILVATLLGTIAARSFGFGWTAAVIIGIAISVASTVVLIRVLADNDALHTSQGHIAVGWLIVEDIFTVLVLVSLPAVASLVAQNVEAEQSVALAIGLAVLKIATLAFVVLAGGRRFVPWLLGQVARTRSRELFTLTVLAIALAVAVGSAQFFAVSMALGAFLAGLVVAQTEVSHQAAADALPMRDAFAVLFFVSVGMLFDPRVLVEDWALLALLLAITLVAKPLTAFAILWLQRYTFHCGMTVAIALAQVGEFSFLLADEAIVLGLLQPEARSLLVAVAIVSITINPLLFNAIGNLERLLRARPDLWRRLTARSEAGGVELNRQMAEQLAEKNIHNAHNGPRAVIVGYGPVGQTAARLLRDFNLETVVIDLNLDTIRELAAQGHAAIYGDCTRQDILSAAGISGAKYLLVTVPDVLVRTLVIITAKKLNQNLFIFTRARYLNERAWLAEVGATQICTEEAETALGLAMLLLKEMGADEERVRIVIEREKQNLGVLRAD